MLLNKERCSKCRFERSVRKCPRLREKNIGWQCCNSLRVDQRCPAECPYAAKRDEENKSPFPAFRSDSNTEYVQCLQRYIDLWCYQPEPGLEGKQPADLAAEDPTGMLAWLGKFQYPANFPIRYLMEKLSLEHSPVPETQNPESIACAYMDTVIGLEWEMLRPLTANDWDDTQSASLYQKNVSSIPLLQKTTRYDILHAGAADDGVSAIVVLELNHKHIWTILLSSASGTWKVKQHINGSPQLYYKQNELFHALANALGANNPENASLLLQENLPLYPDCADLYYYRGLYHMLLNKPDKALADLETSVALDNHFYSAAFTLSSLLINNKSWDQALMLLYYLKGNQPDDLNVQNNIAVCEDALGNKTEAERIWNEILKQAPTYELARKNLERRNS
jgi:hypothetical protein